MIDNQRVCVCVCVCVCARAWQQACTWWKCTCPLVSACASVCVCAKSKRGRERMSGFVSLINIVDKWPIQRDATDVSTLLSPPTRNIFTLTHKIQVGGISQLHQRRDCSWSHGVVHIWDAQILTCCKYVNTNVTNRYCTSYYRLLTLSHLYHDPFTCVRWLIHMCAMTPSYVCHDPFTCVPWLIHMCAMTHSHKCHDSFT